MLLVIICWTWRHLVHHHHLLLRLEVERLLLNWWWHLRLHNSWIVVRRRENTRTRLHGLCVVSYMPWWILKKLRPNLCCYLFIWCLNKRLCLRHWKNTVLGLWKRRMFKISRMNRKWTLFWLLSIIRIQLSLATWTNESFAFSMIKLYLFLWFRQLLVKPFFRVKSVDLPWFSSWALWLI